jgi:hypothetical protein
VFLAWALGVAVVPSAARAQRPSTFQQNEARTHFQAGAQHYEAGEFTQAVNEFQAAYRLYASPVILFNLAQALRSDGRLTEAVTHFRRYLDEAPRVTAEQRHDVEETIRELDTQRVTLSFEVEPAGATLLLDGRTLGTLPLARAVEVLPGEHTLVFRLDNHEPRTERIEVSARGQRMVNVTLRPTATSARLTVTATPPEAAIRIDDVELGAGRVEQSVAPGPHTVTVSREGYRPQTETVTVRPLGSETVNINLERVRRSIFSRPWFWVVAGGTLLAAGVGTWLLVSPPQATPVAGNSTPSVVQAIAVW